MPDKEGPMTLLAGDSCYGTKIVYRTRFRGHVGLGCVDGKI